MPDDVLTRVQRTRAAAAYEAARMVLAEDPSPEDVIKLAEWIVTGTSTPDVRVLPSESLIQQVVRRVGDAAARSGITTPDAASGPEAREST